MNHLTQLHGITSRPARKEVSMAISLTDLSPKARQQAIAKLGEVVQKENKLHAKEVQCTLTDGTQHTFDSKHEYERYQALALLERSGIISDLQIQVPFELIPRQKRSNGYERPVKYIADFVYVKDGQKVVEDAKGYKGGQAYAVFVIKRKLMLERYGIEVKEV